MRCISSLWVGVLAVVAGCTSRPVSSLAVPTNEEARDALVRGIQEARFDALNPLAEELETLPAERIIDYHTPHFHLRSNLSARRARITAFFENVRIEFAVTFTISAIGSWRAEVAQRAEIPIRPEPREPPVRTEH